MRLKINSILFTVLLTIMTACSFSPDVDGLEGDAGIGDIAPVFGFFNLPGAVLSGSSLITVAAYDDHEISNVAFYLGTDLLTNDSASPYVCILDTTSYSDGAYILKAVAWDDLGQSNFSTSNITINNGGDAQPLIISLLPANAAVVSNTVSLTASASDDVGINNVFFYLNSIVVGNDSSSPYSASLNTTSFTNGIYRLIVVAYDTIGQTDRMTNFITISNVTDNDPVVSSITVPSSPLTGVVSISAAVSDDWGITNVYFYAGTNLLGQDNTAPYTISVDTYTIPDGDYTLRVVAVDSGGHTGQNTESITIDNISQLSSSAVYGNDSGAVYSIDNTVDGNASTHWISTSLALSDVKWIAYKFSSAVVVNYIELINDYSHTYAVGDLEILSSSDSTDGNNGTWTSITSLDDSNDGFVAGDGSVTLNKSNITWIKLFMTFNGTGATGGPPSLVFSEIKFWGRIY